MIRTEDDGLWIDEQQKIAVHHELVFASLTTEAGLMQWLPVACDIDARTGGLITLAWDAARKRTTTIAILDFDPNGQVVWDWQAAHADTHVPIYWRVEPSVEKGAIVNFRQGPFARDPESLTTMAREAWFWCWHLCNLRAVLEAKFDMRSVRPL